MAQQGWDVKVKKFSPKILLNSLKDNFRAWIGVSGTQLTLNDIAFSTVKTVKKTIGGVGVAGCDFNFATAANQSEQVIDLGAIIPANARVLDVRTITNAVFTGAVSLVADLGNASGGAQFVGSATIYAANAINAMAAATDMAVAPVAAASKVFLNATPGANWSLVTAGKVTVLVTYIEPV